MEDLQKQRELEILNDLLQENEITERDYIRMRTIILESPEEEI